MGRPMATGRMMRKNISNSVGFSRLSERAAVLFCMLIPHFNSHGKMNGGYGYIKDEVCPRLAYLNLENIPSLLHEITEHTNVKWFEHDGRMWLHALNFLKEHQDLRADRLGDDRLPDFSGTTPEQVPPEVEVEVKRKSKIKGLPDLEPVTDEVYIQGVKEYHNNLPEETTDEWKRNYGDVVNVDAAIFAATTWLIENPRNRKKNIRRFYGNWLRNQFTRATQPRPHGGN